MTTFDDIAGSAQRDEAISATRTAQAVRLLRGACHRAALRADPLARNDGGSGCRHLLQLLRGHHRKTLVALRRHVVADLAVDSNAADIWHEDLRLARDVGAHVPGIGLRIE